MKVIIVDDERLALEYLERQLMKFEEIEIIGAFSDPLCAREEILRSDVDVVFLDINLPEINGIELAGQIIENNSNVNVVFVTAYNDYAVKAFELNTIDYIVKPVRFERLTKTVERLRNQNDHHQEKKQFAPVDHHLYLHVFRQFMLEKPTGRPLILQWRTTKAQELFLYLLQHRGQLVRKSVLIDLLWPEYESERVYSQLYTAIYHIRKTLQPFGDHFQIANTTEGYILSMSHVTLDIEAWESKLAQLPPIHSENIDVYLETLKLYTGDYLQEYDYWWAESERQRLKRILLQISYAIANWYLSEKLIDLAIVSYTNICNLFPQEETAHFSLMKIYLSKNHPTMVQKQYNQLVMNLQIELNISPSLYISQWYEQNVVENLSSSKL